ncbi:hypothetical protein V9T40_001348 [Parthenolecanium corni]|uniref:PHD-type domain-containing protein n=1 Tax=Parthenolecanium corni TaxID=536013 RepID=A0AAN9TET1_9HEMI
MSSSLTLKESVKADKQQTPDSTTKERCFFKGDEIFVLENDQFVFGKIIEVHASSEECLIEFPNGQTLWVPFKNIKPTKNISQNPIKCCVVCKSTQGKKNNAVMTCETCSRGYHQKCHKPIVKCLEDEWNCSLCCKERNCQLSANTVTQKTVSSTSKDPSLPGSSEDLPYYNTSCSTHTQLLELPPTPPSSVSAPETPQPSIVNGEPPISPTEDICCGDFDDVSPNEPPLLNLDEIFSNLQDDESLAAAGDLASRVSDISFPLRLNGVISGPLIRSTKRKLSEADLVMVDGEIKYKRRRSRKRISSTNLKAAESLAASASKLYATPSGSLHQSPLHGAAAGSPAKTFTKYSDSDLRNLVRKYYEDENRQLADLEVNRIASGEEYRICGKRKTLDGRVQYLVEWFKCNRIDI